MGHLSHFLENSSVSPTFSPLFRMSYTAKVPSPEAAPQLVWKRHQDTHVKKKRGEHVRLCRRVIFLNECMVYQKIMFIAEHLCFNDMCFILPVKVTTKRNISPPWLLYVWGEQFFWPKNHLLGYFSSSFHHVHCSTSQRGKILTFRGVKNMFTIRIYKSCK